MINKETLEVMECYVSSAVAGRLNDFDSSVITKCCKRKKPSYKGAYWCYKENCDTFVPKIIYRQLKVIRIDDETNDIKEYKTINEASKELNIQADNIIKCCKGERNRAGRYRWSFMKGNDE